MTEHFPEDSIGNGDDLNDFFEEVTIDEPVQTNIHTEIPRIDVSASLLLAASRSVPRLSLGSMRTHRREYYAIRHHSRYDRGFMMPTSHPEQVEQEALPERFENEAPRAYLTRVLAPKPEVVEEYQHVLDTRKEQLELLHFNEPETLAVIQRRYGVCLWAYAGEDGAPLPAGVSDSILSREYDRSFELLDADNLRLFKAEHDRFAGRHSHDIQKYDKAADEVYVEAIKQSHGYTFLKSFTEPPEQFEYQEVLLTPFQKLVQTASLRGSIAKSYGIKQSEVEQIESGAAYNKFMIATYALDRVVETRRVSAGTPTKSDAAYEFFNAFVEAAVQEQWPKQQRDCTYTEAKQKQCGESSEYHRVLLEACAPFFPVSELSSRFGLLADVLKEAQRDPEDRSPFEQVLETAVTAAAKYIHRPSESLGLSNGSIASISTIVWLRQNQIPPQLTRKERPYDFYGKQQGMVNKYDYERLTSETLMHVIEDNRSEEQRQRPTLLTFTPQSELAPESKTTLFSCTMQAEDIPDGMQPWFAGYELASEKRDENGVIEYGFVEGGHNPYDVPPIPLDSAYIRYALPGKVSAIAALRTVVAQSSDLTLNELSDTICTTSNVMIPDGYADSRIIQNEVLYTQCTGANELLAELAEGGVDSVRTIKGYVLAPGDSVVTRLGHVQTLIVHDGKQYILDATPSGDGTTVIPQPKPAVAPPQISSKATGRSVSQSSSASAAEDAPRDPDVLERQRAERTLAEHPQRMRNIQTQLEQILAVRFCLDPHAEKDHLYDTILRASVSDADPLREAMYLSMTTAADDISAAEHLSASVSTRSAIELLRELPREERRVFTRMSNTTLDILRSNLTVIAQEYTRVSRALEILS